MSNVYCKDCSKKSSEQIYLDILKNAKEEEKKGGGQGEGENEYGDLPDENEYGDLPDSQDEHMFDNEDGKDELGDVTNDKDLEEYWKTDKARSGDESVK